MGKIFLGLFLFFIHLSLFGQVTTSGIKGRITDNDSESLAGAMLLAMHVPSGTEYSTVANAEGWYNLQGLRPGGPYIVEVMYVGMQKTVFSNLSLRLGETETLDVNLNPSAQLDEIVITATPLMNRQQMGASANFDLQAIQETPTISRNLFDVMKQYPLGVQLTGASGGATMSFAGSNNKYNTFQLDGIVSNDVFGLSDSGINGGLAGANPISLDAIEELQVVVAPFDVRYGRFSGGNINAITKSGTNEWHGSGYWYYNNQNFYGKTPGKSVYERTSLSDQNSSVYGMTLGGPLLKNRLFLFLNYEYVKETTPSSYVIGTEQSALNSDEIDSVVNKLSELTNGYNGGGYGLQSINTHSNKILAKIDWNINAKNKFMLRYSFLEGQKMNFLNARSAGKLNHSGCYLNNKTHALVSELNTQITSDLSNELRFGWTQVRDARNAVGQPLPNIIINNLSGNTSLEIGTEKNSAANALDQDIFSFENNLILNKGRHMITIGTQNEFFKMKNLYISNMYGSYVYNSIDDFLSVGTPHEVLPNTYEHSYSNMDITGTNRWAPAFGSAQLGFYAQDIWRIVPEFSLTYGLRMDIPVLFDTPRANELFNTSQIAQTYQIATDRTPSAKPLLSPRIGFRWILPASRATLLRGGLGIFTGRIPFVWLANNYSNAGVEMLRTSFSGSLNNFPSDFKFSIDPQNPYKDPNAKVPTSEINVVSHNFRYPSVFRMNLAIEHELPGNIQVSAEGLYSKTLSNILYENLNYQPTGETLNNGGDNRPLYTKQDDNFTQIMLLKNTHRGYAMHLTGRVQKAFDFGLNAQISYTYGQVKSLNDGNSSQAYSGWKYNPTYYGDSHPELTWSAFDVRNRVLASVSYHKSYGRYFATTVSLFYNGQTGGRFSLLDYTDLNRDGYRNDLLYIPTDTERQQMVFTDIYSKGEVKVTAEEQKRLFSEWIDGNKTLRGSKGKHLKRNQLILPFEHHFDFHIDQDFKIRTGQQNNIIRLSFDLLNIGNLLNKAWGLHYQTNTGFDISPLTTKITTDGASYQFYNPGKMYTNTDLTSRWHAQVGAKYIF